MRLMILGAVIGATLLGALPASADSVTVRANENGVVVREGSGARPYYRNGVRRTVVTRSYASCRTVRVRTTLPNGTVVVKSRRTC
jgi:hypothetical protein